MLFGASLSTGELGHDPTMDAARQEGYRQFPKMPTKTIAKADWERARMSAEAEYGDFVTVKRGTHGRRENPIETIRNMTGEDPVIVVGI